MCLFFAKSVGDKVYKVKKKHISLKGDGHELYALALIPSGNKGKYPTIIGVHGFNGTYRDFSVAAGLCQAKSGFAVICFDFFGGNNRCKSGGTMKDMSLLSEVCQLSDVINQVKEMDFVDENNLFLVGQSQGGFVSAITAPMFSEIIRGMVLYYPAFSVPDELTKKYGRVNNLPENVEIFTMHVSNKYFEGMENRDFYREASEYKGPVMVLHGDADTIVDIEYGRKVASIYGCPFNILPGENHGLSYKGKLEAAKLTYKFIDSIII